MSSGPSTHTLSAAAAYVLRSLMEHPERRTAERIACAPHAAPEIDARAARDGLSELGRHGLAAQDAAGWWRLTDTGREAQQRA